MNLKTHFNAACRATAIHFGVSLVVIALAAYVVFGVWYPAPLDELADGRAILWILIAVDLTCGPLLTFIVASPGKTRLAFWGDISVIGLMQLAALSYGVLSLYDARPVFLAFEGDRFRVVSAPDIDRRSRATEAMLKQPMPNWGPLPIGVRLLDSSDPDYLQSLQEALAGNHPSFRPDRWVPYTSQKMQVIGTAQPLEGLANRTPSNGQLIAKWLADHQLNVGQVRYLPLENQKQQDWVVLIQTTDAKLLGYIALDGWR